MKTFRHHLKHWFVAHAKNQHRPHLIRAHGIVAVVGVLIVLQVINFWPHPVSATHGKVLAYATGDISIGELFSLTNQQRAVNGLPALHLENKLDTSASLKAANMFQEDYWAHVSPSGIQPWYWFTQAGYSYSYAGENLAKDFDTSAGVMDGWMNSPGHRANILNPNYSDVGFAIVNGTLVGGQTTLIVAHYGKTGSGTSVAANVVAPTPKPATRTVPTPVPTAIPAATPVAVQTPVSTPTPVPTVKLQPVVAVASVTQSAPAASSYQPIAPLAVARSLTLADRATLLVIILLLVVYIQTHFIVWRKGLKRWRKLHYRVMAGGQIAALITVVLVIATTGGGRVG